MFFQLKQKIVFGFLFFILSFVSVFSMEISNKAVEKIEADTSNAVYSIIVDKLKHNNKQDLVDAVQEHKKQILGLTESVVLDSLNLDLTVLVKNQKFFEEFSKSLVNKIVGTLDSIYISVGNELPQLSEIAKLDDCDKINLTIFLMQSITKATKPSGLIRFDHKQIKSACKQCGKVTCVCCVCITCAGVTYLRPEIITNFAQDCPKTSNCCLGTVGAGCLDMCCCKSYFLKEFCAVFKKIWDGIKCRCCDDDDKDSKV